MASPAMNIRGTYVRVQEAAEILGVVPNTVRKWGAAGKIRSRRSLRRPTDIFRQHLCHKRSQVINARGTEPSDRGQCGRCRRHSSGDELRWRQDA
ncbi:MAG: helix-turn-helix domain-containing protein [Isosphaeraceae bacterium]